MATTRQWGRYYSELKQPRKAAHLARLCVMLRKLRRSHGTTVSVMRSFALSGNLAGVDDAEQFAAQHRALLLEVTRLKREARVAEGKLGISRTDSWANVTRSLIAFLSILEVRLVLAQERLVAFDKDLGND